MNRKNGGVKEKVLGAVKFFFMGDEVPAVANSSFAGAGEVTGCRTLNDEFLSAVAGGFCILDKFGNGEEEEKQSGGGSGSW